MTQTELSEYRKRRINVLSAEVDALRTQNAELIALIHTVYRVARGMSNTEQDVNIAAAVIGTAALRDLGFLAKD